MSTERGKINYSINEVGLSDHLGENVDSLFLLSIKINSRQNKELNLRRTFRVGTVAQWKSDYLAYVRFDP